MPKHATVCVLQNRACVVAFTCLRRVNVPLRLPEWLVQWIAEQPGTPAELIEAALLARHKLRPPRAP